MTRAMCWFRSDLRVADHAALFAACERADRGVVGVFVISSKQWADHDWSSIKVDLLLRSLSSLRDKLEANNVPLRIVHAAWFEDVPSELLKLAKELECDELHFGAEHEWDERQRDEAVRDAFEDAGMSVTVHRTRTLADPGSVRTGSGGYYGVFTPFKKSMLKHWQAHGHPNVEGMPAKQSEMLCESDDVPDRVVGFQGLGDERWAELWPAGEDEARRRLGIFCEQRIGNYHDNRDTPGIDGTSSISPYLTLGMVSPARCLREASDAGSGEGVNVWISEILWREFYQHLLVGHPRVSKHQVFREEYDGIEWDDDADAFEAWCEGRTGVPIVDAAMRQLKEIGWMHNRCRMIVAMFLTKNLFQDWRKGEKHFMTHLVDGDLGSNNGGWQWSSSTGTDAQPYFRVFNPVSQSESHDKDGAYIKKYVPELEPLDGKALHAPWEKASDRLEELGYPEPIVDLKASRKRAIEKFKSYREG